METNNMAKIITFHPKPNSPLAFCKPLADSVEVCLDRLKKDYPDVSVFQILDESELPQDRYFRDAWIQKMSGVSVDLEKGKDIHINFLRQERNEKLKASDQELLKAVEQGQDLTELQAKRQALRDMPVDAKKHLDHISDLDAIKKFKPDILK